MVATSTARNTNEGVVESGRVCFWQESGVRQLCWCIWQNLSSVAMKMFSHLIYFTKKCYKLCTSSSVCKNNAAINRITVEHKNDSFLSTLTVILHEQYYNIFVCVCTHA
jgi:hypothetical protein